MNEIEQQLQPQTYTISCAGQTETVNALHLPMRRARDLADTAGKVAVIFHSAGRQYVYPN